VKAETFAAPLVLSRAGRCLRCTGILAVQFRKRALDRQRRPRCAFSIVFLGDRITEQRHQSNTQFLGDAALVRFQLSKNPYAPVSFAICSTARAVRATNATRAPQATN
jgi:hypothetical protein